MILTDPLFYLAAVPAIIVVGLSKAGFGGGLGVLGIPMMALVISPLQAAGIMLPILVVMDIVSLTAYWGKWDAYNLKVMVPSSLVGIGIGWALAHVMTDDHIRLMVGVVSVAFVVWQWVGRAAIAAAPRKPSTPFGLVAGTITGFVSFIANAGGPPSSMFLLPQRLPKEILSGTMVYLFAIVNASKLVPFALLGQLGLDNLATSAVLFPVAVAATAAGVRLVRTVPERPFYIVAYASMGIVGVVLLAQGIDGLWLG